MRGLVGTMMSTKIKEKKKKEKKKKRGHLKARHIGRASVVFFRYNFKQKLP